MLYWIASLQDRTEEIWHPMSSEVIWFPMGIWFLLLYLVMDLIVGDLVVELMKGNLNDLLRERVEKEMVIGNDLGRRMKRKPLKIEAYAGLHLLVFISVSRGLIASEDRPCCIRCRIQEVLQVKLSWGHGTRLPMWTSPCLGWWRICWCSGGWRTCRSTRTRTEQRGSTRVLFNVFPLSNITAGWKVLFKFWHFKYRLTSDSRPTSVRTTTTDTMGHCCSWPGRRQDGWRRHDMRRGTFIFTCVSLTHPVRGEGSEWLEHTMFLPPSLDVLPPSKNTDWNTHLRTEREKEVRDTNSRFPRFPSLLSLSPTVPFSLTDYPFTNLRRPLQTFSFADFRGYSNSWRRGKSVRT